MSQYELAKWWVKCEAIDTTPNAQNKRAGTATHAVSRSNHVCARLQHNLKILTVRSLLQILW